MFGFIPVVIALVIAASYTPYGLSDINNPFIALAAALVYLLSSLFIALIQNVVATSILKKMPAHLALPRLSIVRKIFWILILCNFGILIHYFNWPALFGSYAEGIPAGRVVFSILPFMGAYFIITAPLYRLGMLIRKGGWTLAEYYRYALRQALLPLVPYLSITAGAEIISKYFDFEYILAMYPAIGQILSAFAIAMVFIVAPLFVRFLFPAWPLEQGELRTRLESLSAQLDVKIRQIYVWKTGGGRIPNAAVAGASGFFRYIFLTDALIDLLSVDEIETVFAHEMAHARHKHLYVYLVLVLGFTFSLFNLSSTLNTLDLFMASQVGFSWADGAMGGLILVLLTVLFWVFGFGMLSRALEQQADLSASIYSGNMAAFNSALEKLAWVSGGSRNVKGWRHHSVAHRVDFLMRASENPELAHRFLKKLTIALAIIFTVFLVGALGVLVHAYKDITRPRLEKLVREADYFFLTGIPERIEENLHVISIEESPETAGNIAAEYLRLYAENGDFKNAAIMMEMSLSFHPGGRRLREILYNLGEEAMSEIDGFFGGFDE